MNKKQQKLQKQLSKKIQQDSQYDQIKATLNTTDEFSVANLLESLAPTPQTDRLIVQQNRITTKARIVAEPEQKRERQAQERKVAAQVMRQNLKKWLPIVKQNREADHLNFAKLKDQQSDRIQNVSDALQHNQIAQEIEIELRKNKIATEEQVVSRENLTPQQQQLLSKRSSLAFHQELKNKRISKIKSKVYHRIKKRKSEKEKMKLLAQLNPAERQKEIEKLKEERARERVTLRHSTKNKFTQALMRFGGDKQTLQQQQNYLNQLRHQLMKKAEGQFDDDEFLDQLDDDDFKNKAIEELEKELENIETQQQEKGLGLKFLERQKTESLTNSKNQIQELIGILRSGQLPVEKEEQEQEEDERLSWEGSDEEKKKLPETDEKDVPFTGRAKFVKEVKDKLTVDDEQPSKKRKVTADAVTKQFIAEQEEQAIQNQAPEVKPKKVTEVQKQLKEIQEEMTEQQKLLQGLNYSNLKQKYKKTVSLNQTDDQILKESLSNFVMNFDENENENQFLDEKIKDMETYLPSDDTQLKGWGSWAGYGVKQKRLPSQEELLQRKINKIKDLQKKRKDAHLHHVIVNEKRDSAFSKFLVKEIPHEFQSKEQFEYVNAQPIGPEWNSFKGHQQLVRPRIVTKAGHIINPIKVPNKN